MNKEEIEMLKKFINLGISESASEDIRKYGYLGEKVFNYINQLETNRDELKEWLEYHKVRPTALSTIYAQMEYNFYEGVLNKMKELERGKFNE